MWIGTEVVSKAITAKGGLHKGLFPRVPLHKGAEWLSYISKNMRVTLRQVADSLGLHRSTLGRALRNDPRIPAETRKRIKDACEKMGYRPNAVISELASSRWRSLRPEQRIVIAYIDLNVSHYGIQLVHNSSLREALQDQANLMGYQLDIIRREDFSSSAKLQRHLTNRGITDILVSPSYEGALEVALDWPKFICVQVMPGSVRLNLHSVARDQSHAVLLAWRKAVEYGYRRIGITLMNHSLLVDDDLIRLGAMHICQNRLFPHLAVIPPFEHRPYTDSTEAFVAWVKKHEPDVLIGFNVTHYSLLRSEIGPDIAFANLHKVDADPLGLSGVFDSHHRAFRESVNLLHFCRRTYQWGIPKDQIDHVIRSQWFDGNSMPRRN